MPTFRATHNETGEVVEYDAPLPQPEHRIDPWRLEQIIVATPAEPDPENPPDTRKYGGRRSLTKLEFIALFTDVEYVGLITASKSSPQLEAWIKKLDYADRDADGYSVHLDDPRTQAGVNALEMFGLLAVGRAAEVLNG
jgi:hypothetical protein